MTEISDSAAAALCLRAIANLTEAIGRIDPPRVRPPKPPMSNWTPGRRGPTPRVSDAEIASMHAAGMADNAIAKRHGMSQVTISRRLRRLGLAANGQFGGTRKVRP